MLRNARRATSQRMNFSGISSGSVVGRLLRAPLSLVPSEARMRVLQGPLRGSTWIAGAHTHGCWLGSYEFEKQELFSSQVPGGGVVYDVGANAGFYSLLASKLVGPSGHVIAFEPQPRNLRYLRAHVRLNRLDNVTVLDLAVGDRPGTAKFNSAIGSATGSIDERGDIEVRVSSLDALEASAVIPPPSLIKMDIEGGELAALNGAQRILAAYHPLLLLATHGTKVHEACIELLQGIGYELTAVAGSSIYNTDELLATWQR